MAIYDDITRLTRRWTLGGDLGFASYVRSASDEEPAIRGIVNIERVDGAKTVTGTVDLVFAREGRVRGRFQANWVDRQGLLCG